MYYRLNEGWQLCGWENLPFALRSLSFNRIQKKPYFTNREGYSLILDFDGVTDVDPETLSEKQKQILQEMLAENVITASGKIMEPLADYQRYRKYRGAFVQEICWSVTGKCNYRCRHCLLSAPDAHHASLFWEESEKLIEQMAENGLHCVQLTGGEPLVSPHFPQIVESLTRHGILITEIYTNGALVNDDVLDLLDSFQQRPLFQVSFDGVGWHDWLRGMEGAEEDTLRAIRLLVERKFPVTAAMCIHRKSVSKVRETVRLLSSLGVESLTVNVPQITGFWKQYAEEYGMTYEEELQALLDYIPQYYEDGAPLAISWDGFFRADRNGFRIPLSHLHTDEAHARTAPLCGESYTRSYLSAEGRLLPCMGFADTEIEQEFPIIIDGGFAEATMHPSFRQLISKKVADLYDANAKCHDCPEKGKCGGNCPAVAYSETGSLTGIESVSCWFHRNHIEEKIRACADAAYTDYRKKSEGN